MYQYVDGQQEAQIYRKPDRHAILRRLVAHLRTLPDPVGGLATLTALLLEVAPDLVDYLPAVPVREDGR